MKILTLLLSLISLSLSVFPQETNRSEIIYSFVPQYLINRGIRIDLEKQISSRHMLQVCPQFYLSERDADNFINDDNEYSYLIGGGMSVFDKIFTSGDYKKFGLYLSYGLTYNFFSVDYTDFSGEVSRSASGTIHKAGADLLLGYQFFIHKILSVDLYTGLGTRISSMDAGGADTERFNTGYFGYNYTGNLLQLGIRIGVIL